jgi:hypothetical protein
MTGLKINPVILRYDVAGFVSDPVIFLKYVTGYVFNLVI